MRSGVPSKSDVDILVPSRETIGISGSVLPIRSSFVPIVGYGTIPGVVRTASTTGVEWALHHHPIATLRMRAQRSDAINSRRLVGTTAGYRAVPTKGDHHDWASRHATRWAGMGTSWTTVRRMLRVAGRPRGRLAVQIRPSSNSSPPHTPHGSLRSSAPCRHWTRDEHLEQITLARATSINSSEKKRYDNVPFPSLHRLGESTRTSSSNPFDVSVVGVNSVCMMLSFLVVMNGLASRRKAWGENKKTAGFTRRPRGAFRREICYVRCLPRRRAGRLVRYFTAPA